MKTMQPSTGPLDMIAVARRYRQLGLSFLPIGAKGNKKIAWNVMDRVFDPETGESRYQWGHYRQRRPTTSEIEQWYGGPPRERGIAIVCGAISGHLEAIDCDSKDVADEFESNVRARSAKLLSRLVVVESPRGRHYYYRSDSALKMCKLARQKDPAQPAQPRTLIDLKGENGYVIAPPSPGSVHPSGIGYEFVGARTFENLTKLSPADHEMVLSCARECDTWVPPMKTYQRPPRPPRSVVAPSDAAGDRPGDDFNANGDWADVLEPHGWTIVGTDGTVTYWQRPGKSDGGHSATTGFGDADLLHVFSTNAWPFETDQWYTKFSALILLRFGGNLTAAVQHLASLGYGRSPLRRTFTAVAPEPLPFVPRSFRR